MKIAIVGTAESTRGAAPYGDDSWQIWSLGANIHAIPRYDRWFELHHQRVLEACGAWQQLYPKLKQAGEKLTIGHPNPNLPDAKLIPLEELMTAYGKYFTSSIAWMIAMAIHEKPTEIGIWGVEMQGDGEYAHQKPCCEYFLGMAKGMGIKVYVPEQSTLLRAERMYAIEKAGLSEELIGDGIKLEEAANRASEQLRLAIEHEAYVRGQRFYQRKMERRWG